MREREVNVGSSGIDDAARRGAIELLLDCARVGADPEAAPRVRARALESPDWDRFMCVAAHHRMAPLACRSLLSLCPDALPQGVSAAMAAHLDANARWMLLLTAELRNLLRIFETAGLAALPFKGPVLAALAYDDPALRPCGDLDFLIDPRDALAAQALLARHGYRPLLAPPCSPKAVAVSSAHHFAHERTQIVLDLHWRLLPHGSPAAGEFERFWSGRRKVALDQAPVASLSAEDHLLVLCIHGAKHRWARLGWIADVAGLLGRRPAMNWDALFDRARAVRCRRMLALGLSLASSLLDAPAPADWLLEQKRSDPRLAVLQEEARCGLLWDPDVRLSPTERVAFFLRTMDGTAERVRYRVHQLFDPTLMDWGLVALPDALFPLYRVIRPLRLGWEGARRLLRRAGGNEAPSAKH